MQQHVLSAEVKDIELIQWPDLTCWGRRAEGKVASCSFCHSYSLNTHCISNKMIQGSWFLTNFSEVHTMTSNQITQLWETHSVPARHHILIVLLNVPRALLLTINTRGTSNPVFIHTSNFLYGKTNCLHYEQSWFYTTISGRFVSKPLRFWWKCGFDLFNAFAYATVQGKPAPLPLCSCLGIRGCWRGKCKSHKTQEIILESSVHTWESLYSTYRKCFNILLSLDYPRIKKIPKQTTTQN